MGIRKGNQSDISRELKISRAAVSKQIKNRDRTGIPEKGEDGLYDLDAVREWYLSFRPGAGPKRGIRAEVEEVEA